MTSGQTSTDTAAVGAQAAGRALSVSDAVFPLLPVTGVLLWARQAGVDSRELFSQFDERDPHCRLSYSTIREGVARAMHRYGGAQLACLTGGLKSMPQIGVLGPAMMTHDTVGAAVQFGIRFQQLAGCLVQHRLVLDDGQYAIESPRLFDDAECGAFFDIDHLLTNINLLAALYGRPAPLSRIELAVSDRALCLELERRLGVPVLGDAASTRVVLPAGVLDTANPGGDPATREFWTGICEREMQRGALFGAQTLMQRLHGAAGELRRLEDVADELHVSLRTLHRLLVREGIDYSALHDRARRCRAEAMLRRGARSDDIAAILGLSDVRSFRRAFRRWSGLSPAEFRQREAAGGAMA